MKLQHAPFCLTVFFASSAAQTAEDLACLSGFQLLGFDAFAYQNYSDYFSNDSFIRLAAAGTYVGPAAIEEYVKFSGTGTSLIVNITGILNVSSGYWGINSHGFCSFYQMGKVRYTLTQLGGEAVLETGVMSKLLYNSTTDKIAEWHVYYPEKFLADFFTEADTQESAQTVCSIVQSNCTDTWTLNNWTNISDCVTAYEALPLVSGTSHIDGLDKGCRILHSSFTKENPFHCAHLSIAPQQDPNGNTKCQTSQALALDVSFEPAEMSAFAQFESENNIQTGTITFVASCVPTQAGLAVAISWLTFMGVST